MGVHLTFGEVAPELALLRAEFDLVVAADGLNSAVRGAAADHFRPTLENRHCRYIWFGTDKVFDAFTFDIRATDAGVMQVHAYPYDATGSTLIVEMTDEVWRKAGFASSAAIVSPESLMPGDSDDEALARCEKIFADLLDGHARSVNNSRWINFATVRCETWHDGNVVLLGDAAHTAHFSIGSGTKLAMEDALALVACLSEQTSVETALEAYEAERKPVVVSTQRAAQASLEWFENLGQYIDQAPMQFAFNLLTRSRRVTYDNLRLRDPEFVARMDDWFAASIGEPTRPPMFHPLRLRGLTLPNRVIVSPMDMYSSTDGMPGRLPPRAPGQQGARWRRPGDDRDGRACRRTAGSRRAAPVCGATSSATTGGGSCRSCTIRRRRRSASSSGTPAARAPRELMWDGIDEPLPAGNWPVVGPSALPYTPANQVPRELSLAEMAEIKAAFVAAAVRAAEAGFDLLELHCAHGYLLSSFLSPLTNRRTDAYGGSIANRLRYPLEIFDELRAVWPADRPMSVRLSATDWAPDGNTVDDAIAIARAFAQHGVDAIDVSTGQVVSDERPAFGRSYQVPFADAIRQAVPGVAVIAVGAISSYDDVNSLLLAGRADLCALGRTHLYDPQWTLHAAAEQGYVMPWPAPFAAGEPPTAGGPERRARSQGLTWYGIRPRPPLAMIDGTPVTDVDRTSQ